MKAKHTAFCAAQTERCQTVRYGKKGTLRECTSRAASTACLFLCRILSLGLTGMYMETPSTSTVLGGRVCAAVCVHLRARPVPNAARFLPSVRSYRYPTNAKWPMARYTNPSDTVSWSWSSIMVSCNNPSTSLSACAYQIVRIGASSGR